MATWEKLIWAAAVSAITLSGAAALHAQTVTSSLPSSGMFSISGLVIDVEDGIFSVRSGRSRIQLQLTDWPSDLQSRGQVMDIGDSVTATGWFNTEIFTDGGVLSVVSLHVEDLRTYFTLGQSNTVADRGNMQLLPPSGGFDPIEHSISLIGTIVEINGDEMVVSAGEAELAVNTASLKYDPFDNVGIESLNIGDTVMIDGMLDQGMDLRTQLEAQQLTRIVVVDATS